MVTQSKKQKKPKEDGGVGLDDALSGMDDEDVVSGESKPRKAKKKTLEELEDEIEEAEEDLEKLEKKINGSEESKAIIVKASKPISKVKKGDRIRVDGKEYTVDTHYVLMDHGSTKEMAIEIFDKNDKDYQLRYFSDQVETSMEFYELQEIIYIKKPVIKVEW